MLLKNCSMEKFYQLLLSRLSSSIGSLVATSSISWCVILGITFFNMVPAYASANNFTGTWKIDIRSTSERHAKIECGYAIFTLRQVGNTIRGDHIFATAGCGRLNEGGDGSVQGYINNGEAILFITSGRNDAVVRGKAKIKKSKLIWETLEETKSGTSDGDSSLILSKGVLHRVRK